MKKNVLLLSVISAVIFNTLAQDGIVNGVHGYTPKSYVHPTDPVIKERLEWFRDQKLALMMHFGLYSVAGIRESWPLSDEDGVKWSRSDVDWTKDNEVFKKWYLELITKFDPVRLNPDVWAKEAAESGFKYFIFTTKHHDGFCLFDSKYSNYKTTSPECPFSDDPRADIVKTVFDAFRAKEIPVVAYFSKPDWHHNDYWENYGLGYKTTRTPSYSVEKNPERWNRFQEYTRNQILEIIKNYGRIEAIWLDGGQVQRRYGLDIKIEEIIAEARKIQPWLISVDRTARGQCENVITPEQTVPKTPIAVPWESCVTMGKYWSYHYNETYKSSDDLIRLLVDVVAKGGNLALNITPQPDGRLPRPAVERMRKMGEWLKVNGNAIYSTRPLPPYRKGDWAYTRNRVTGEHFAIRLLKDGEALKGKQFIPDIKASKVVQLATGKEFELTKAEGGVTFELPVDFVQTSVAEVFKLTY